MRRFFFLQNSPVDCFVKPKELTELGTGRSQFVRAGVQRVQPFVHGYRECNTPVQVKGGSLAQLSGVSPLSTGYYLTQKAARNQLRCPSPLSGKSKRKGGTHVKLTRHNGRAGKNGVYNPKHNDRSFDIANSEHIDEERAKQNLYWDCYNGFRNFKNPDKENELSATFEDVEQLFYRQRYRDFVTGQNERNVKNRHPERNKETGDLLKSKKTCPEETVYQIGTLDNHVPPELLIEIVTEFMEIVNERFGSHVHILNWALHLDESTPHIHERHVFDCENQYGEIAPQQEKALEALGFELPEPEKPVGRKNNRKMTFDSACRVLLFDVAKKHGLQLEEEPEYGGRAYLEKQDYILFKQKEQLAAQEQKLEELTMKIEDVEALVDEVADIAYLLMKFLSMERRSKMNEQTIILIFLVMALGITLWLYILKAIKQVNYKGDERWKLIQLKANNPLFAEVLYKKNYIEYLLDILLYGSLEERKALVAEQRKEVLKLEQRIAELSADRTMHSRRNPKQLRAERER